ncbi:MULTISPECIES: Mor transcription activator family protein [Romboutsia]|uniref:Mor transcription activator family protein n=1 Tax=Romboutsia TaxID=1501226 RepID=UPI002E8E160F|nr:Mor transcription activator family protein [Romboutsia hominis]
MEGKSKENNKKQEESMIREDLEALYELVGEEVYLEICKLYGGNSLYVPTYSSAIRDKRNEEIIKRFNGVNASILAREYKMSVNHIRRIVKCG